MSIPTRRERERERREKLIITAARELAEAEGWEAVTTRRLAERIEYSQPVLYSHFKGMGAIMAAVAVEGFADLAEELRAARTAAPDADRALADVSAVYTAFAGRRPAVYDAMFSQTVDLPFASPQAPAALQAAFGELAEAVRPHAGGDDLGLLAETFWAALHGLVTLTRGGRLPPSITTAGSRSSWHASPTNPPVTRRSGRRGGRWRHAGRWLADPTPPG